MGQSISAGASHFPHRFRMVQFLPGAPAWSALVFAKFLHKMDFSQLRRQLASLGLFFELVDLFSSSCLEGGNDVSRILHTNFANTTPGFLFREM